MYPRFVERCFILVFIIYDQDQLEGVVSLFIFLYYTTEKHVRDSSRKIHTDDIATDMLYCSIVVTDYKVRK